MGFISIQWAIIPSRKLSYFIWPLRNEAACKLAARGPIALSPLQETWTMLKDKVPCPGHTLLQVPGFDPGTC